MTHREIEKEKIFSYSMAMLPPTLKNSVGTPAAMETEGELSTCVSASLGNGTMNRLPVKRRLFADETPENAPPDNSLDVLRAELFAKDKKLAKEKYGFDVATETPSTSSEWEYTAVKASDVPKFYTQVRGKNSIATFSPRQNDRFKEFMMPMPISIPILPTILKSEPVVIPSISETVSEITDSSAATTSSTADIILGASAKEVTPPKPRGKKKKEKAVANNSPISGQSLLTRYFLKKRSASIDSIPSAKKKRASTEIRGASQGETSSFRRL